MPRAKRPLAEADPNASRRASKQKSSKTSSQKIRNTADRGVTKNAERKQLARSRRDAAARKPAGTATALRLEKVEKVVTKFDSQLQSQAQMSRPRKPMCDYDGSNSHWASRDGRELETICERLGIPGSGPRAALLKWLDTGSVEYEDLYACSLESMCYKRGIKHKSGAKKVDLIRHLKEADEQESLK